MTAVFTYDVGDVAVLSVEWQDTSVSPPVAVNPSGGTTCVVRQPDGTETPCSIIVDGALYEAAFRCAQEGQHWYRFATTGDFEGAEEAPFLVRTRRVR